MPRTNDSIAPRSPRLILISSTFHFNNSTHTKNINRRMVIVTPLRGRRDHFVAASSSIAVPPDTVRNGESFVMTKVEFSALSDFEWGILPVNLKHP